MVGCVVNQICLGSIGHRCCFQIHNKRLQNWVRNCPFLNNFVTSEGAVSHNVLYYQQLSFAHYQVNLSVCLQICYMFGLGICCTWACLIDLVTSRNSCFKDCQSLNIRSNGPYFTSWALLTTILSRHFDLKQVSCFSSRCEGLMSSLFAANGGKDRKVRTLQ